MADLAAGTVSAVEELAFNDDAAADTGAQSGKDHVVAALAAALPEFAQSGNVCVVTGLYGETGELGQLLGDVEHTPAQVNALVHNALCVDGAGNADAQTQNVLGINAAAVDVMLHGSGDIGQDLRAVVFGDGGDLPLVDHGAVFVKVSDLDGGAAKVNAEAIFHIGTLLK